MRPALRDRRDDIPSLLGAADLAPFKVSDVEGAARTFPEINFQIVHAGWAYLEETSIMMERYANIFANLEMTFSLVINQPLMFAEIIGRMLFLGLEDQIVFSDGCNIVHPNPGLQAFRDFQMPRELVEGKGYAELTDEIKGKPLTEVAAIGADDLLDLLGIEISPARLKCAMLSHDSLQHTLTDLGVEQPQATA